MAQTKEENKGGSKKGIVPHSADVAAWMRGLPKPTEAAGKFCYTNCLKREYDTGEVKITTVRFQIGRNGNRTQVIEFGAPVTEKTAIQAAETYLSEPVDEKYYETIREDLFHAVPWVQASLWFKCRGDCLTDARFLESVKFDAATGALSLLFPTASH